MKVKSKVKLGHRVILNFALDIIWNSVGIGMIFVPSTLRRPYRSLSLLKVWITISLLRFHSWRSDFRFFPWTLNIGPNQRIFQFQNLHIKPPQKRSNPESTAWCFLQTIFNNFQSSYYFFWNTFSVSSIAYGAHSVDYIYLDWGK